MAKFTGPSPTIEELNRQISSPLWESLSIYLEKTYSVIPSIEYSCCSMQRGWNIKYRKGSRALCTIYPNTGFVTCMISIGKKEEEPLQQILPKCTKYLQKLYESTASNRMGRWLMIDLTEEEILEDVKKLLALRAVPKR